MFTQVWYTAYKDLTVVNIDNNTAIRVGLFAPKNAPAEPEKDWLARL